MSGELMRLHPYQKEVLDQIINPKIRKIVMCSAAQMLKTSLMTAAMCYFIVNDSSNIAYASSTGKETQQYASAKFHPTIERSGIKLYLTDKNDKSKSNNQNQTQLTNGDFIYWMNLNAPSTLRSKSIRRVFLDECSNVDIDSDEGNPIALASARTAQFQDGLVVLSSTPKLNNDLIVQEYKQSDQRRYFIKCPHCQYEHEILFKNIKFEWKQIDGGRRALPVPETARLHCPECQKEITESQRIRAVSNGRWKATNPEVTDVVGYSISRLYSPLTSIQKVVQEYSEAYFNFSLMTFYNNILGEPYEDEANKEIDLVLLENLRNPEFNIYNIPNSALGIICTCDQQQDRLEVLTAAFDEKNIWLVDWRALYAPDCTKIEAKAWTELSTYITKSQFKTQDGRLIPLLATFVDSSNGSATNTVYRFCSSRGDRVHPIKGSSSPNDPLFVKSTKGGQKLILFNVNLAKTEVRKLINGALSEDENLPMNLHFTDQLPDDWFIQLTSETLKRKGENLYWVLKPGQKRNEAIDLTGYVWAGMAFVLSRLGNHPYAQLRKYRANQKEQQQTDKYTEESQPRNNKTKSASTRQPRRGGNWLGKK